ncbi:unnamed protein product [Heligmosomoides polygyrus]|uniref:CPSF_A domain-containing protein n=1 Tax=Heligmosomoides polygyrus TaxID=6339 RepID=A0A183FYI4_HELPZ|nr:unnamed protein product [Heligmosomoides polygyrus]
MSASSPSPGEGGDDVLRQQALDHDHRFVRVSDNPNRTSRLRLKRCGSVPALTVLVAYAPTSDNDDEEVEAFYVEQEKFYNESHTLYKVVQFDGNQIDLGTVVTNGQVSGYKDRELYIYGSRVNAEPSFL